jgi:hypothetical protein
MRPYLENTLHKNRGGGVAQGEGPEFKPQYHKKKKEAREFGLPQKHPFPYHWLLKLTYTSGLTGSFRLAKILSMSEFKLLFFEPS